MIFSFRSGQEAFHTHYIIFNAGTPTFFRDDIIDFPFRFIETKTFMLPSLDL